MSRLAHGSAVAIPVVVIGLAAMPCFSQNLERLYESAVVLWQAEEPTCFDRDLPFLEQMEEVEQFEVGGAVSEPRRVSSGELPQDLLAGSEVPKGVPVHELVVSASGSVESVVALRPTSPELDAALAEHYRSFRFEPATANGTPVCVRYILTIYIAWR
jgi:hypothetical protein